MRQVGRARLRSALLAALAVLALAAAAPAYAGWGKAFRFGKPLTLQPLAPQLAISATGATAALFGEQDEDNPSDSQAIVAERTGGEKLLPGAQELLAGAFAGSTLELLSASGGRGRPCCASAQLTTLGPHGLGSSRKLFGNLEGVALGDFVALPGQRLLAALASADGVWVSQSGAGGQHFGHPRQLTAKSAEPWTVAATPAGGGGHTVVAWTAIPSASQQLSPSTIEVAQGSVSQMPHGVQTAVRLPAGAAVDELAAAPTRGGATLAWIESYYDAQGAYHAQPGLADLGQTPASFPLTGVNASGLAFAGDAHGDQVLVWKACDNNGSCSLESVTRGGGGRPSAVARLGSIDAAATPAAAVGSSGAAIVAWVFGGRAVAVGRPGAGSVFGAQHELSSSTSAADVTVAFGAGGAAKKGAVAWDEGTVNTVVEGEAYTS